MTKRIPEGLLAQLTLAQIEALDDLDHNCDLISVRPNAAEIDWTLERAGAGDNIRTAVREAVAP